MVVTSPHCYGPSSQSLVISYTEKGLFFLFLSSKYHLPRHESRVTSHDRCCRCRHRHHPPVIEASSFTMHMSVAHTAVAHTVLYLRRLFHIPIGAVVSVLCRPFYVWDIIRYLRIFFLVYRCVCFVFWITYYDMNLHDDVDSRWLLAMFWALTFFDLFFSVSPEI